MAAMTSFLNILRRTFRSLGRLITLHIMSLNPKDNYLTWFYIIFFMLELTTLSLGLGLGLGLGFGLGLGLAF